MTGETVLFDELSVLTEGSEVVLLRSPMFIRNGISHAFSTRIGGVSSGVYASMNLRMNSDDSPGNVRENYRRFAAAVGFDVDRCAAAKQIHSDIIRGVYEPETALDRRTECDALVTKLPGMALMAFGADCVPILLCDPVARCVAAVHSGWRGTAANIVAKAAARLVSEFSARPSRIFAAIGPAIAGNCYEVDALTAEKLSCSIPSAERFMPKVGTKYYPDLRAMNRALLEEFGVPGENIEVDAHCTKCLPELLWSHRRDGNARGVMGGVIWL